MPTGPSPGIDARAIRGYAPIGWLGHAGPANRLTKVPGHPYSYLSLDAGQYAHVRTRQCAHDTATLIASHVFLILAGTTLSFVLAFAASSRSISTLLLIRASHNIG